MENKLDCKLNCKLFFGKTKDNKIYCYLGCDLGYRVLPLTFKDCDIAELLNITIKELYDLKNNYKGV